MGSPSRSTTSPAPPSCTARASKLCTQACTRCCLRAQACLLPRLCCVMMRLALLSDWRSYGCVSPALTLAADILLYMLLEYSLRFYRLVEAIRLNLCSRILFHSSVYIH